MARPCTATQKAEKYLVGSLIDDSSAAACGIRTLASRAGVSYMTMWKAVQSLKKAGRLQGAYRVSGSSGQKAQVESESVAGARLESQITADLLSGEISRGVRLLSFKELSARYATSPSTLRRILREVHSQGLIVARGRHYEYLSGKEPGQGRIVLLAFMQFVGAFELPQIERDVLRACEMTCSQAHLGLDVVVLRRTNGTMVTTDTHGVEIPFPSGPETLGYVYLLPHQYAYSRTTMRRIRDTDKPCALFDNGSGIDFTDLDSRGARNTCVFNSSASVLSGMQAGTYILAANHRHAAYISPFHSDPWSQLRWEGLSRVFAKAGPRFSLSLFSLPHSMKDGDYVNDGRTRSNARLLEQHIRRWSAQAPESFRSQAESFSQDASIPMFLLGELAMVMEPQLDAVAARGDITAWIMANDIAARVALQYCKRKAIAVPDDVAILGFDDAIESTELRITSYSFNPQAVADAMVHYVLHPSGRYWRRRRIVEIKGRIIRRASA